MQNTIYTFYVCLCFMTTSFKSDIYVKTDIYTKIRVRYDRQDQSVDQLIPALRTVSDSVLISDLVSKCYISENEYEKILLDTITVQGEFTQEQKLARYELRPEFEHYFRGEGVQTKYGQIKCVRTGAILMQGYASQCTVGNIRSLLFGENLILLTLNLIDNSDK